MISTVLSVYSLSQNCKLLNVFALFIRVEQELLARIVSEMNQPLPDPTLVARTPSESSLDSSVATDDGDMLGEKGFHFCVCIYAVFLPAFHLLK